MLYCTELHCHTQGVSVCGKCPPEEAARLYIEAGYAGVVVTDHMNRWTFRDFPEGTPWETMVKHFISGWERFQKAAGDRLFVMLGMELRFDENDNDYLVYGITPEFLLAHPEMMEMNPASFSELAHENGCMIFQAHPFRNRMTVIDPRCLDGIEVYNGHKGHDSRNDIAQSWAERYGLLQISGSDSHYVDSCGTGGILTPVPVRSSRELLEALKSQPQLIRE